jgi:hypothetical protein
MSAKNWWIWIITTSVVTPMFCLLLLLGLYSRGGYVSFAEQLIHDPLFWQILSASSIVVGAVLQVAFRLRPEYCGGQQGVVILRFHMLVLTICVLAAIWVIGYVGVLNA